MSNNSPGNSPIMTHLGGVLFVFVMTVELFSGDGLGEWISASVVIWFFIWIAWTVYHMGKG